MSGGLAGYDNWKNNAPESQGESYLCEDCRVLTCVDDLDDEGRCEDCAKVAEGDNGL